MRVYFSQSVTYSEPETPNVQYITNNPDGSEDVTFSVNPDTTYTYTVTITDSYGDVHIHEGAPSVPDYAGNDYYGLITGFNNGGDFTVNNNTENGASNRFTWLFTSAPEQGGTITLYPDARGGPYVAPACFLEGSRVLTTRGEVAVEDLAVGDRIVTASGQRRPIRWIGHRTIDCAAHPDPDFVRPIRIAAGAFGDGKPYRELVLLPHHAVGVTCVSDALIPIRCLTNGSTIARIADAGVVTYWHVELDTHDLLLANGLEAETYIDVGNRSEFEGETGLTLHPVFAGDPLAAYCRPLVTGGPVLAAVRAQLAMLAGVGPATPDTTAIALVVDGIVIAPTIRGDQAAFFVPAGSGDLRLVSTSWTPRDVDAACRDDRRLGVMLEAISVDDGLGSCLPVALDAGCLVGGFHPLEVSAAGTWRWTDGDALIAAAIRPASGEPFLLRLTGQFDTAPRDALAQAA